MANLEAAPSLDAERAKLRRDIFKNAERRAAVVKDLQVCGLFNHDCHTEYACHH